MDTNGCSCLNAAAGSISRHQLVQFHNRVGPRAQQVPRCTVWQHKCHNSSFVTIQYFIWVQQFVPVCEHKIEESSSSESGVRLLNSALFVPASTMRRISSSKLVLLRNCIDTALSKPLNGLFQMCTAAEYPFTHKTIWILSF